MSAVKISARWVRSNGQGLTATDESFCNGRDRFFGKSCGPGIAGAGCGIAAAGSS